VIALNPGRKKFVHVAPGAGRKLQQADIIVSQYKRSPGTVIEIEGHSVVQQAGQKQHGGPALLILSDFGEESIAKETLLVWKHNGGLHFSLPDCVGVHDDLQEPFLSQLVTALVRQSAFQSRELQHWLKVEDSLQCVAHALESLGFARCESLGGDLFCCILNHALTKDVLSSFWDLGDPQPALAMRDGIALEDRTSWELFLKLLDAEWSWGAWRNPRTCSKNPSPLGYAPGDPKKIWSPNVSRVVICPHYLRALLCAEELCLRLEYVPHGRPSHHYKQILDGGDLPPAPVGRGALCDQLRPDLESLEPDSKKPRIGDDWDWEEQIEEELDQEVQEELEAAVEAGFPPLDADPGATPPGSPLSRLDPNEFEMDPEIVMPDDDEPDADDAVVMPDDAEAVPPPPPPLAVPGAARIRHVDYLIDARGDGLTLLKHDTQLNILSAHCRLEGHGNKCRLNRSLNFNARKPSQGSPIGFLIAWLRCAGDFTGPNAQKLHSDSTKQPEVLFDARYDFATRSHARAWVKDNYPHWLALFELEFGDGTEPEDQP
jgi:hypothetical protein